MGSWPYGSSNLLARVVRNQAKMAPVDLSSSADLAVILGTVAAVGGVCVAWLVFRRRGREVPLLSTDPPGIDYGRLRGYQLRVTNAGRGPINDLVAQLIGVQDQPCGDPDYGHYIGYLDAGDVCEFRLAPDAGSANQILRIKYTFRDTGSEEREYISRAEVPPLPPSTGH